MATRRFDKTMLTLYACAAAVALSLFTFATVVYTHPRQSCTTSPGIERYFSAIVPSIVALTTIIALFGGLAYTTRYRDIWSSPHTVPGLLLIWSLSVAIVPCIFSARGWPTVDCADFVDMVNEEMS